MNFEELLRDKPCDCGMTHRCSIKHVIIESGAVQKVGSLLGNYRHILLVADTNTYATCGPEVEKQIGDKLERSYQVIKENPQISKAEFLAKMQITED